MHENGHQIGMCCSVLVFLLKVTKHLNSIRCVQVFLEIVLCRKLILVVQHDVLEDLQVLLQLGVVVVAMANVNAM